MAVIWSIFSVSCSILVTPFLMFLLAIIFLASIGKSLGVRRLYVKILLKIFEDSKLKFCSLPQYPPQSWGIHFMSFRYGRESIEIAQKDKQDSRDNSDDEDEDDKEKKEAKHGSNGTNHIQVGNHISSTANNVNHSLKIEKQLKNGVLQNSSGVISREDLILAPDPEQNYISDHGTTDNDLKVSSRLPRRRSFETLKREFELSNCLDYIKAGVEAIIEDQVTLRFEAEELKSWNLLTRTNRHYEFISWRLSVIWMVGFLMRYFFLLPLRILICFFGCAWMAASMSVVGLFPSSWLKRWLHFQAYVITFRILARSLSAVINVHNKQYMPRQGGVCVANHTSPIDIVMLSTENCFSLIGQRHGGFLGVLQRALARASPHIWFERSEVKDREAVARRLREHVSDPNNPPILIFPEGTCINNTSVMQFKKGSFEVGSVIYPVAIKYDPKFGDAFWNSSRYSMMQYLYMMMSSWAIVCDVWYLPPMYQQPGESAIDFANRVKSAIARQGGLVDLMWDGQLKRMKAKPEWKEKQQEEFSKRLKVE